MNWILDIDEIHPEDRPRVGGKAFNLARLHENGFPLPQTVCLTTRAYEAFVDSAGIRERIQMELNRKPFAEMRWEEVWDTALRIRHLFAGHPMPAALAADIADACNTCFGDRPVAVRSSAPEEDAAQASFAGLHESYLNIRGPAEILKHIKWVWASLWSDAALLYRQELGLAVETSAMAVVIQEVVAGALLRGGLYPKPGQPRPGGDRGGFRPECRPGGRGGRPGSMASGSSLPAECCPTKLPIERTSVVAVRRRHSRLPPCPST